MIVIQLVTLLLTAAYIVIFLFYLCGWLVAPPVPANEKLAGTTVSVVIAARNEEKKIANLLSVLLDQEYPANLMEILVIDDHSEDGTAAVVREFHDSIIRLVPLKDHLAATPAVNSYKKKAIELGVTLSSAELIITTDADCIPGRQWLATIVGFYERTSARMVVAPVLIRESRSFLSRFQELDLLGMAGITGATLNLNFATMCNGGNLAFQRKAFQEVGGYSGNDRKTSGDDLFLMHKMAAKWKGGVKFLKSVQACVHTAAQPTLREFLTQRMRWTSKSLAYADWRIKANLLAVYFFNLSILVSLLIACADDRYWITFIFQLFSKIIIDIVFLTQVGRFFERRFPVGLFLPIEILHVLYIVTVGLIGNLFFPTWKGRNVS